jgi:hypothetical protein
MKKTIKAKKFTKADLEQGTESFSPSVKSPSVKNHSPSVMSPSVMSQHSPSVMKRSKSRT